MAYFRFFILAFFIALFTSFYPLFSLESEETLAIRRIATCYYEKDFDLTKKLIEDYFKNYTSSTHHEILYVLLADVYLQEKEYEKALALYQMLQSPELIEESFIQKLHCYYSLKNFHLLRKAIEPIFQDLSNYSQQDRESILFYYAESLFKKPLNQRDLSDEEKAFSIYQSLLKTSLEPYAKLSLAYFYSAQKKHELASNYFLESAQYFPFMKEKLLILAAENQSHFDLDGSSNTFYEVKELNSTKSGDAIYNWLILLFHSENFEKILEAKEEILNKVPTCKKGYTHLVLGKTYFSQKKFEEAFFHFQESLKQEVITQDQHQEAIFLSLLSCYHLGDEANFNSFFSIFEKKYRSSNEYPSALFLKAKLYQKKNQYRRAQSYFNKASKYRSSNLCEAATFESALCYFLQNQFQRAHDHLSQFLKSEISNQYAKSAAYYLLQSSSKLYNERPSLKIKQQLIDDYLLTLKTPNFFEKEALFDVYLKIGKLYIELEQYENLFPFLYTLIEKNLNPERLYQAYLLLAIAYKNGSHDLEKYVEYLEKAALYNIPKRDLSLVRLHLFQAYFQQAKENEAKKNSYLDILEKASYNLHQAIKLNFDVPKEHFIWLCQTYFQRIENTKNIEKTDPLINDTAQVMATFLEKFPQSESLQDQYIRFNYAKVLGLLGKTNEKAEFLKTSTEKLAPSHPLHIQSMLELGICYEQLNQRELAIATYEDIISSYSYSIPIVTFTAKLRLARLLTQDYLKKQDPALFEKISKYYRDLHLSKSLKTEPLHLEAALDNALLQNIHSIHQADYKVYLQTLLNIKDEFSNRDNLISKEYHELRERYPNKNKLYEAYMLFIDAKILHLQAKINLQNKNLKMADEKINLAKNLIERLQNSSDIITPYLKEVALLEKEALNQKDISVDLLSSYLMYEVLP